MQVYMLVGAIPGSIEAPKRLLTLFDRMQPDVITLPFTAEAPIPTIPREEIERKRLFYTRTLNLPEVLADYLLCKTFSEKVQAPMEIVIAAAYAQAKGISLEYIKPSTHKSKVVAIESSPNSPQSKRHAAFEAFAKVLERAFPADIFEKKVIAAVRAKDKEMLEYFAGVAEDLIDHDNLLYRIADGERLPQSIAERAEEDAEVLVEELVKRKGIVIHIDEMVNLYGKFDNIYEQLKRRNPRTTRIKLNEIETIDEIHAMQ